MKQDPFKTTFAENIFRHRYAQGPNDHWPGLSRRLVTDVCGKGNGWSYAMMAPDELDQLAKYIMEMKFIPGGRYLYYAGRPAHFWNNCFLFRVMADSREAWSELMAHITAALMCGGGVGADYSIVRPEGRILKRTGGIASGPLSLMKMVNEAGRYIMQGGTRRSAIYGSLNWQHEDILSFLYVKNWSDQLKQLKAENFNFPCPLDMTNISINWDTEFLTQAQEGHVDDLWKLSVRQMCETGEPGHSYNFFENENETLRNACGEITSEDDSDVCNLGHVNFARIDGLQELKDVTYLASKFLACGTVRSDLPFDKVYEIRDKNRRLGVGQMGVHEWLLKRGYAYEMNPELEQWCSAWEEYSQKGANDLCDRFYMNRPVKYRAIAPTGTTGILASTTTGIQPLYAVAYKRRYITNGDQWKYELVIDATAENMINELGLDPDSIETGYSLAPTPEKLVKFQSDMQRYVDHAISCTINLPKWGSEFNNEDTVKPFGQMLLNYCDGLRGITAYPDGARGGQPLTPVQYDEAKKSRGVVFDESEEKACIGGVCGV